MKRVWVNKNALSRDCIYNIENTDLEIGCQGVNLH